MSEDQYLGNLYQRFPVTIEKGLGSHVWDTDNNEYIDCMGGYGVALVGHRNERVVNAIKSQIDKVITVHSSFYSKTREEFLQTLIDIAPSTMQQRMIKSEEEIVLIKSGAKIADIGGEALVKEIKVGASEIDIAMAGRDAMEKAIAKYHPNSELRDTWVWFQSGINTDGAHNPVTTRKLKLGDILSLNTFPMISGYYTALERTLFVGEVDDASMKAWEANVKVHRHGIKIIKPGVKCSEVTAELNNLFSELGYLHRRTFGYGHSFGLLSPYYGREGKLEFREDIETVLKPNMVVSMEPMIFIPEGEPGAGGYREHDILVVNENGCEDITKFPFGPEHNVIK